MKTNLTINVTVRKNKWWWVKFKALCLFARLRLIKKQCLVDWTNITSIKAFKLRIGRNNKWQWPNRSPFNTESIGV